MEYTKQKCLLGMSIEPSPRIDSTRDQRAADSAGAAHGRALPSRAGPIDCTCRASRFVRWESDAVEPRALDASADSCAAAASTSRSRSCPTRQTPSERRD